MSHDHDEKDAKGELLPCPFCGDDGEKGRQTVTQMGGERATFVRIICGCCGAMCPELNWGKRADTARIVAEAVAKEREACAAECLRTFEGGGYLGGVNGQFAVRAAARRIRARSTQPDE